MKSLNLESEAVKFLETLPSKQFRQVTVKVLQLLKNSTPHDAQLLKGFPYYRVDIGEYRVIYRFSQELVTVVLIGKRNDDEVYKMLKRKF